MPEHLGKSLAMGAEDYFAALVDTGRACLLRWDDRVAWVATERLGAARAILGEAVECTPNIATPSWAQKPERDVAIGKLVSAHLDHRGPVRTRALALEQGALPNGARIVSLAPGVIDTDMQAALRGADPARFPERERFAQLKAQGLLDSPAQAAAKIVAFLHRSDFGHEPVADVRG